MQSKANTASVGLDVEPDRQPASNASVERAEHGEAGYIEALNEGMLRERRGSGQVRDAYLLQEAELLNRSTPPPPADPCPDESGIIRRRTIPPPSWKRPMPKGTRQGTETIGKKRKRTRRRGP